MQNNIEIQAIQKVLDKLYYEAKYAFNHDCARCGEMYKKDNICFECREKDRILLEEKIPKWEKRLKEATYNQE